MKFGFLIAILVAICSCSSTVKLTTAQMMQHLEMPAIPMRHCGLIGCTKDGIYLECSKYVLFSKKTRLVVYWASKAEFSKRELTLLKDALKQYEEFPDSTLPKNCNCDF
jgi:hypothetical protein